MSRGIPIDELEEQLAASRKAFADLGRIVIGDVVDAPQIGKTWDGWHDFVIVRSGEAIEKYKLLAAQLTECQSELEDSVEGADHLGSLLADAQYRIPGLVALVAKLEKENAELKQSHEGLVRRLVNMTPSKISNFRRNQLARLVVVAGIQCKLRISTNPLPEALDVTVHSDSGTANTWLPWPDVDKADEQGELPSYVFGQARMLFDDVGVMPENTKGPEEKGP